MSGGVFLSLLVCDEPWVRRNHAHYSERMQLSHVVVDLSGAPSAQAQVVLQLEAMLQQLLRLPEGGLLVCATDDVCVYGHHAVADVAAGHDHLLLNMWVMGPLPQRSERVYDVQVWRRTPAVERCLWEALAASKLGSAAPVAAEDLFSQLRWLAADEFVNERLVALECYQSNTLRWRGRSDVWCLVMRAAPHEQVSKVFRRTVFEAVNRMQAGGPDVFDVPLPALPSAPGVAGDAPYSVWQPDGRIALVMLYTPNIRPYAQLAEANVARYCERHGYAFHVYRDVPDGMPQGVSGNWLKPYLLARHLPDHDWVVWVDADMLFRDQSKRLEPLLAGRDVLAAHDIGAWVLNSGFLGFRNTVGNAELLGRVVQVSEAVPDRSSVYASNGDQQVFCHLLTEHSAWSLPAGVDLLTANTPWFYQQADSLCVHYYGMTTESRLLLMAADEARSVPSAV